MYCWQLKALDVYYPDYSFLGTILSVPM